MSRDAITRAMIVAALLVAFAVWVTPGPSPHHWETDGPSGLPRTFPELDGVWLPPNLAPPAIRIDEPGTAWHAVASSARGPKIEVSSRRPGIAFPARAWRRLLRSNDGLAILITISVRQENGRWKRFRPITMPLAREPIDRWLVTRELTPLYTWWRDLGVYQRDLTGFRKRLILHGRQFSGGCVNCHSFAAGSGERFTLGLRSPVHGNGTLLVADGRIERLDQTLGYGSWHPSGQYAVFSINKVKQFFHAAGPETRDVFDLSSGLVCFDVRGHRLTSNSALAPKGQMTTYPCWSPDGRWLYFSQAKQVWREGGLPAPEGYQTIRYALMRVSFDPTDATWGEPELVRRDPARSLVFPRVSPDGRWLVYTSCDYGCFPIHRPNSDLGLIHLVTGKDAPVDINSERADTWHSWSSNGRWLAFASKRADGLFTKIYLSYFDERGFFCKPLLLPQRDPCFYDTFWYSDNVPELLSEPVRFNAAQLGRAARGGEPIELALPEGW